MRESRKKYDVNMMVYDYSISKKNSMADYSYLSLSTLCLSNKAIADTTRTWNEEMLDLSILNQKQTLDLYGDKKPIRQTLLKQE